MDLPRVQLVAACIFLTASSSIALAIACAPEQGCADTHTVARAQVPASHFTTPESARLSTPSIVIGTLSCILLLCIIFLSAVSFFVRRWYTEKWPHVGFAVPEGSELALRRFTLKELQCATGNFSHKLGRKATAAVFKGLMEGTAVAVKKLDMMGAGEDEFLAAVYHASRVNHPNIVQLLGFCLEGTDALLVYEYLEAGSLDIVLSEAGEALDWNARYGIAIEVAETLEFLHEDCGECMFHGNLTVESILLSQDLSPKIADFGFAELVVREKVLAWKNSKDAALSPSRLSSFKASPATDVFGFGLILLSLVLGHGNIIDALAASRDPIFLQWIYFQAKQGMFQDVVDVRLALEADPTELKVALHLAFACMHEEAAARPKITKVRQALKERETVGLLPITSLAFTCLPSESDENSEQNEQEVVVVDVDREGEDGAREEIEPCYQLFSMRSQRRSSSGSSL